MPEAAYYTQVKWIYNQRTAQGEQHGEAVRVTSGRGFIAGV